MICVQLKLFPQKQFIPSLIGKYHCFDREDISTHDLEIKKKRKFTYVYNGHYK